MQVRLVALVPVLGLLLSGCSGSGDDPEPLPVPTAVPTVSPSAAALEIPVSARANTREGAAAFARYYYESVRLAFVSGNTERLEQLSDSGCQACAAIVRTLKAEAQAGNTYSGGEITSFAAVGSPPQDGVVGVAVNYSSNDYAMLKAGTASPTALPGAKNAQLELQVRRQGDSWVAVEIVRVQS